MIAGGHRLLGLQLVEDFFEVSALVGCDAFAADYLEVERFFCRLDVFERIDPGPAPELPGVRLELGELGHGQRGAVGDTTFDQLLTPAQMDTISAFLDYVAEHDEWLGEMAINASAAFGRWKG